MKTVNADATVVPPEQPTAILTPIPNQSTIPSIINIPPQIATTVCWVALGFALGWYLTSKTKNSHRG